MGKTQASPGHTIGPSREEKAGFRGRLIRPSRGGTTIDEFSSGSDHLAELFDRVSSDSRGHLDHLRSLAGRIEETIAREVVRSRGKIEEASEKAREHIEKRVRDTTRRCDEVLEFGRREGRRSGYREGFSEGFDQGVLEGRFEGEKKASEELAARFSAECGELPKMLETMFSQLDGRWRSVIEETRCEIVQLVLEVSRRVIRRSIEDLPEIVAENLEVAVSRICDRKRLRIEVNPADRSAIEDHLPRLARPFRDCEGVCIEDDPSMERGGCRVISDSGGVDLSIETQLEVIERILLNSGGGQE